MMSDDVTLHSLNIVICTNALGVLDSESHVEHNASCLMTPKRLDHSPTVEEVNRQHRLFCDNGTDTFAGEVWKAHGIPLSSTMMDNFEALRPLSVGLRPKQS